MSQLKSAQRISHYPDDYKDQYHQFLLASQARICEMVEELDAQGTHVGPAQKFNERKWHYKQTGGGASRVLRDGRVFEKAGVNVSRVSGDFPEGLGKEIPGTAHDSSFEAMGISLVLHPRNPHVPIVHLNTRHITTQKSWFGGGADLTPAIAYEEDTAYFHACLKEAYDAIDPAYYPKFKPWADTYFFLPHRGEMRGVGGTFYDYVETTWQKDFALAKATVDAFCLAYKTIVERRMHTPWTLEDTAAQLKKRARYVEFNLIHDRGTLFGLKTGGDIEAILVSMPPLAGW